MYNSLVSRCKKYGVKNTIYVIVCLGKSKISVRILPDERGDNDAYSYYN